MNIIYINHYAGSPEMGMEFRPYYLAREWVKMGFRVDIFAADFSHLRTENPKLGIGYRTEKISGIYYHWVHTTDYKGNGIKRGINICQFVMNLWANAPKIARKYKPNVIITSSTYPLDTYVGQRIRKYSGGVLIHEIHDMWPISPIVLYHMSTKNPLIAILQAAENSFCRNSDKIVSLLPAAEEYLISHGMKRGKFLHVANGIVLEEWQNPAPLPQDLDREIRDLKAEYGFVLTFFGSHTKSYALSYLIDAVGRHFPRRVGLIFIGNGLQKKELIERAKNYDNIRFHDVIAKKCIPSLNNAVDAVYVGAVKGELLKYGICMNKLFDSMMGGRPILYAVEAPNNYVEKYSCGISVEPESESALVKGLNKLLSLSDEERLEMGNNGKNAVIENFVYDKLARKYAAAFSISDKKSMR